MFEKVNPSHPDKVADRIAGALVDLAYAKQDNPKIAVEVLIGHGTCRIIAESSVAFTDEEAERIVERIAGNGLKTDLIAVPQDEHLSENQAKEIRCGDNGIFKGVPVNAEELALSRLCRNLYESFPTDGKMVLDLYTGRFIVCQSHATNKDILERLGTAAQPEIKKRSAPGKKMDFAD